MLAAKRISNTRSTPQASLAFRFNSMFDIVRADTPTLLEQAYRIRYQVYCKEQKFEDPANFNEEREHDEYDERSVHSLLFDRFSSTYVGTVRIILPLEHSPENSLPIQNLNINHALAASNVQHIWKATEISRFSISKHLRRRTLLESHPPMTIKHREEGGISEKQLLMSHITLGLVKATVQMSVEHGIFDLFAVMEPSLIRLLSRFSIYFNPIGPLVEYHGMRQPCYANVYALEEHVRRERPDIWEMLTDGGTLLQTPHAMSKYCS